MFILFKIRISDDIKLIRYIIQFDTDIINLNLIY